MGMFCNKGWFECLSCGKCLENLLLPHCYALVLQGEKLASVSEMSKPSVKTSPGVELKEFLFTLMKK